ncbi:MAG: RES family NAD+ phosphorylase [Candidatus Velthaea sp.]
MNHTFTSEPIWRIIPSRYPVVGIWDRVSDPNDIDDFIAIEGLTNARVRDEAGEISSVRQSDRIAGPGSTPIMAAFAHSRPGRFNDSTFSAYYAGLSEEAAVAESRASRERFLRATAEPSIDLDMRAYIARVSGTLADVRGRRQSDPIYDPDSYAASQPFARAIYDADKLDGVVYRSVRLWKSGECVAVNRPRCLSNSRATRHFVYRWDGGRIIGILTVREHS